MTALQPFGLWEQKIPLFNNIWCIYLDLVGAFQHFKPNYTKSHNMVINQKSMSSTVCPKGFRKKTSLFKAFRFKNLWFQNMKKDRIMDRYLFLLSVTLCNIKNNKQTLNLPKKSHNFLTIVTAWLKEGTPIYSSRIEKQIQKHQNTVQPSSVLTKASVLYEIKILWAKINHVKSHTITLAFSLQTDMNQIFQMRHCTSL